MILRMISGRLRPDGLARLRDAGEPVARPRRYEATTVAEPARSILAVDPAGRDLLAVTVWADVAGARDALDAELAGLARAAVPAEVATFGNPTHFDIESSWLERGPEDPAYLRVAIGRFTKPGAHLEMEEQLRQRMSQLDEDMVVACVGRRMVDRSVDVLFLSGWRRRPIDIELGEAIWSDISLRYDQFSVRVYLAPRLVAVQA